MIGGDADEGYGRVADAFRRNLSSEIGAAVAVYRDERKVVDLWAGRRDGVTGAPWCADTLVTVFSTTKGVAALTIAVAASRGLIDYDAPVADYWPEFAQAGKGAVTVRQLLGHQAGLVVIDPPLTTADLADPEKRAAKLAAQAPWWPPGSRHGYHAITLGWYESELVRRVDPDGRTLGRFFAEEVAAPLGLDFFIGLPPHVDRDRVARLQPPSTIEKLRHLASLRPRQLIATVNPYGIPARAGLVAEGVTVDVGGESLRDIEIPAGNGIGDARSLAKVYGAAATGGSRLGWTPAVFDALKAPAVLPTGSLRDVVAQRDASYSLGFSKPAPTFVFGSTVAAFGTPGAGGSFGFADPDTGVGFAYVMNRMGLCPVSDPRELRLRQALFCDVLGARPQS